MSHKLPVVLTIAGTDPSGGAGIQADLKTFTALGCYGTSAVTAVVAQNTQGVQDIHALPSDFVEQQIRCVSEDMEIHALKTGMLFDHETVRSVCGSLSKAFGGRDFPPLVVDPVCVSTSGHTLLAPEALETLVDSLLPLATLITPNRQEAEEILSIRGTTNEQKVELKSLDDMIKAAKSLADLGPENTLVKGGHVLFNKSHLETLRKERPDILILDQDIGLPNTEVLKLHGQGISSTSDDLVVDVLYLKRLQEWTIFARRRIETNNTHGTGCTLSAAITCYLAQGYNIVNAVRSATKYTHLGIETAPQLGHGNGPLNHMHSLLRRATLLATPSNPFPFTRALIEGSPGDWRAYVEHRFVHELAQGVLSVDKFKHFIKQDYKYLEFYARAYGVLAGKSTNFDDMSAAASVIQSICGETAMHISMAKRWGISSEELRTTVESPATLAYGQYLLNIGIKGDYLSLMVALMACLIGYGEVGLWIKTQASIKGSKFYVEGNPYQSWIEDYAGERYQSAVAEGIRRLEAAVANDPLTPMRFEEMRKIWLQCTRAEKGFWDMAYDLL